MNILTQDVENVALAFMEGLDCPRSLMVSLLIKNKEWDQLFSLKTIPHLYDNAQDYHRANGATCFLKKWGTPLDETALKAAALQGWLADEKRCFEANSRLDRLPFLASESASEGRIYEYFVKARKNVRSWLGYSPGFYYDVSRFGPGATVSDSSDACTIAHKMSSIPTFTPDAIFHLVPWISTMWGRAVVASGDEPVSVRGNEYFTVPKTASSLRTCAKEPSINGFYQLGLGTTLRGRLRDNLGIDLDHAQDFHRQVACTSSIDESYCTIDLSSASDTICSSLVRMLLPSLWFDALDSLRSRFTTLPDGKVMRLEKFSSMGNGFTFELETVIFLGLLSVVPGVQPGINCWVFGDDIICPSECYKDVEALFTYCGLRINRDKSFSTGPFRESCGGDFFNGTPVRGCYQKEDVDEPQKVIALANRLRSFAIDDKTLWHDIRPVWFKALDLLPTPIRRLRGPLELGDLVITDDEQQWNYCWRNGIRWFKTYRSINKGVIPWSRFFGHVQIAVAVYGVTLVKNSKGRLLVPGRNATGYKVGRAAFS